MLLLAMEFLLRREHSMETLGLAEIVYPGLEVCSLPTLDHLTSDERNSLAPAWSDFLAGLCDLMRTRGCITLGEGDDEDRSTLSYPIGSWMSRDQTGINVQSFVGAGMRNKRAIFTASVVCSWSARGTRGESSRDSARCCIRHAAVESRESIAIVA